jgi:hypothetical protein
MIQSLRVVLAGTAGFLLAAAPLSAQGDRPQDPRDPPPVTWCAHPSPNAKWARQTVSVLLEIEPDDSSEAQQRLRPYLPFLLSGIAERYIAQHQPSRDINAPKPKELPAGDPRYGPTDVGRMIFFDVMGNGTIDSIIVAGRPSLLTDDLKAAILAAEARGDVFGPYADSTVRTRLALLVALGEFTTILNWPAFTLYTPVDRPAMADPKNRAPAYPADALHRWEGKLLFKYVVDENGKALPESVGIVGADKLEWESNAQRQAYQAFKRAVEKALPKMRFLPAEANGCYVKTWVQQQFIFEHER